MPAAGSGGGTAGLEIVAHGKFQVSSSGVTSNTLSGCSIASTLGTSNYDSTTTITLSTSASQSNVVTIAYPDSNLTFPGTAGLSSLILGSSGVTAANGTLQVTTRIAPNGASSINGTLGVNFLVVGF